MDFNEFRAQRLPKVAFDSKVLKGLLEEIKRAYELLKERSNERPTQPN